MGKKKDVIIKKLKHTKSKLTERVKKLKLKTVLKLGGEVCIAFVVISKLIVLILWEINTFINK